MSAHLRRCVRDACSKSALDEAHSPSSQYSSSLPISRWTPSCLPRHSEACVSAHHLGLSDRTTPTSWTFARSALCLTRFTSSSFTELHIEDRDVYVCHIFSSRPYSYVHVDVFVDWQGQKPPLKRSDTLYGSLPGTQKNRNDCATRSQHSPVIAPMMICRRNCRTWTRLCVKCRARSPICSFNTDTGTFKG